VTSAELREHEQLRADFQDEDPDPRADSSNAEDAGAAAGSPIAEAEGILSVKSGS